MKPSSSASYRLILEGSQAFADIEQNGMRVDEDYLDRIIVETGLKIKEMEGVLKSDEVFSVWRKQYGEKADLGSRQQLGEVIFKHLKVDCKSRTKTGRPSTDESSLEDVDFPFVKRWVDLEKLKKARSTFLIGLRKETVNGYVHPFFNLHLVTTYRSSSSDPNLQNQPNRDVRQSKLIRRAFIPRGFDYQLVEIDYSALEFRGCASFWKDAAMVAYASDPSLDIHRDMAAECYNLDVKQVSKEARFYAKNQFVFPILYGSYYVNCAKHLWEHIGRGDIRTVDGVGLYDHLIENGIGDEVSFESHIKVVEDNFNRKFPTWSSQKEVWWEQYLKRGWFPLSTGFVCHGVFSYNNLMNTPVQGPSFHCLLWSLIRLNDWLKKYRMKSRIICQIHDSILADVHDGELQDYVAMARQVMTVDVRKEWSWIITPLAVGVEGSKVNWFEKKALTI